MYELYFFLPIEVFFANNKYDETLVVGDGGGAATQYKLKFHINGTFSQKEYHELTLRAAP